jgi:hypothetical protein
MTAQSIPAATAPSVAAPTAPSASVAAPLPSRPRRLWRESTEAAYLRATLAKLEVEFDAGRVAGDGGDFAARIGGIIGRAREALDRSDVAVVREYIHVLRELKVEILRAEEVLPALYSMREAVLRSQLSDESKKLYADRIEQASVDDPAAEAAARALLRRVLNRIHSDAQTREWKLRLYRRALRDFTLLACAVLAVLAVSVVMVPLHRIAGYPSTLLLDMGLLGSLGALVNGMRTLRRLELDLSSYNVLLVTIFAQPVVGFVFALVVFLILGSGLVTVAGVSNNPLALMVLAFVAGYGEGFVLKLMAAVEARVGTGADTSTK